MPSGRGVWLLGGCLIGLLESIFSYDARLSFSPIADWTSRLLLVPALYGLTAALLWVLLGTVLRPLMRRVARRGAPAHVALATLVGMLVLAHIGIAVNLRFDEGVSSPLGLAVSAIAVVVAVVAVGCTLLACTKIPALASAVTVLDRYAARGKTTLGLIAALAVGGAAWSAAAYRGPLASVIHRAPSAASARIDRVLLIGLDAADWTLVWPMMRAGDLPNLDKLARSGRSDFLHTYGRSNSPMVWTSIATGMSEDRHGIHDFTVKPEGSYEVIPTQSFHRKVKAIWNMAGDLNKTVTVVDYPITFPPEEVPGVMVSRLHSAAGPVAYPQNAIDYLDAECRVSPPAAVRIESFEEHASDLSDRLERVRRMTLCLLETQPAELFMVYTHTSDAVQHLFWKFALPDQFAPELWDMDEVYGSGLETFLFDHWRSIDGMVGDILDRVTDDTLVLVASDHGAEARPQPFASLQVDDILATMGWRSPPVVGVPPDTEALLAYDGRLSRFHEHVGIVFNLAGREPGGIIAPEHLDTLRAALIEELAALITSDGQPLFLTVDDYRDVEELYRGRFGDTTLDILCTLNRTLGRAGASALELTFPGRVPATPGVGDGTDTMPVPGPMTRQAAPLAEYLRVDKTSGGHTGRGLVIARGPGIRPGPPPLAFPDTWTRRFVAKVGELVGVRRRLAMPRPTTLDMTPTMLYALGAPIARDMDGSAMLHLFDDRYVDAHPLRWIDTYEIDAGDAGFALDHDTEVDEKELEYLRALGYIN